MRMKRGRVGHSTGIGDEWEECTTARRFRKDIVSNTRREVYLLGRR